MFLYFPSILSMLVNSQFPEYSIVLQSIRWSIKLTLANEEDHKYSLKLKAWKLKERFQHSTIFERRWHKINIFSHSNFYPTLYFNFNRKIFHLLCDKLFERNLQFHLFSKINWTESKSENSLQITLQIIYIMQINKIIIQEKRTLFYLYFLCLLIRHFNVFHFNLLLRSLWSVEEAKKINPLWPKDGLWFKTKHCLLFLNLNSLL